MLKVSMILILAASPAVTQGLTLSLSYPFGSVRQIERALSGADDYLFSAEGAAVRVNRWNTNLGSYEELSVIPINAGINVMRYDPSTGILLVGADDGLHAYDLSNPASPTERWFIPTSFSVKSVDFCADPNRAVFTAGLTVRVVQVSSGSVLGSAPITAEATSIACGQTRMFVGYTLGIQGFDLTDPYNPQSLGTQDPTSDQSLTDIRDLLLATPTGYPSPALFVADQAEGAVYFLDPSTFPLNVVGNFAAYGMGPMSLGLFGTYLFIGGVWELIRLNIQDPANPAFAGSYYPGSVMNFLSVRPRSVTRVLYKAAGEPGVREADFGSTPPGISVYLSEPQSSRFFQYLLALSYYDHVNQDYRAFLGFAAAGAGGLLHVVPLSLVARQFSISMGLLRMVMPVLIGKQQPYLAGVSLSIYDTGEELLHLVRAVDTTLQESATLVMPDYVTDFQFLNDSEVVVAFPSDTVQVLNIATLSAPQVVSTFVIPGIRSFVLLDTLLIAAARSSGLQIWSIADPASPYALGQLSGVYAEVVGAGFLPLAGIPVAAVSSAFSSTTHIVDLSNPTAPSEIGSWSDFNVDIQALDVAGNFLFVGGGSGTQGVVVALDLSTPSSPVEADRISVAGSVIALHASDSGDVSVSTYDAGAYLLYFPEVAVAEGPPRRIGTLPFALVPGGLRLLPSREPARFTVLDALGREVVRTPVPAAPYLIRLTPGVYFWRLEGKTPQGGRVVVLR